MGRCLPDAAACKFLPPGLPCRIHSIGSPFLRGHKGRMDPRGKSGLGGLHRDPLQDTRAKAAAEPPRPPSQQGSHTINSCLWQVPPVKGGRPGAWLCSRQRCFRRPEEVLYFQNHCLRKIREKRSNKMQDEQNGRHDRLCLGGSLQPLRSVATWKAGRVMRSQATGVASTAHRGCEFKDSDP